MGHELLAQESIQEAAGESKTEVSYWFVVDAYTRAVKLNPMDVKAWYGLGQTHEQSDMHSFALHYFEKFESSTEVSLGMEF